MAPPIMVFYEDSLAPNCPPTNYGPHVLVCACVAERFHLSTPWALMNELKAHPCNGAPKVLARAKERLRIAERIYLLLDTDKPIHQLGLGKNSAPADVSRAVAEYFAGQTTVFGFGLERNVETVVKAACTALQRPMPQGKPNPALRDAVLIDLARNETERTRVLSEVPSLKALVDALAVEVKRRLTSPP